MLTCIICVYQFRQDVNPAICRVCCKILPHHLFECSIKPFNYWTLVLTVCVIYLNGILPKQFIHITIQKLSSSISPKLTRYNKLFIKQELKRRSNGRS